MSKKTHKEIPVTPEKKTISELKDGLINPEVQEQVSNYVFDLEAESKEFTEQFRDLVDNEKVKAKEIAAYIESYLYANYKTLIKDGNKIKYVITKGYKYIKVNKLTKILRKKYNINSFSITSMLTSKGTVYFMYTKDIGG